MFICIIGSSFGFIGPEKPHLGSAQLRCLFYYRMWVQLHITGFPTLSIFNLNSLIAYKYLFHLDEDRCNEQTEYSTKRNHGSALDIRPLDLKSDMQSNRLPYLVPNYRGFNNVLNRRATCFHNQAKLFLIWFLCQKHFPLDSPTMQIKFNILKAGQFAWSPALNEKTDVHGWAKTKTWYMYNEINIKHVQHRFALS